MDDMDIKVFHELQVATATRALLDQGLKEKADAWLQRLEANSLLCYKCRELAIRGGDPDPWDHEEDCMFYQPEGK